MPGRYHGHQRLLDHEFEGDARRLSFTAEERYVHLTAHQRAGQVGRCLAGEGNLAARLLLMQDAERVRQPDHLMAGQEADHESRLLRLHCTARRFACGFNLKQCQSGMVEKGPPGRSELDATRTALQQLDADLELQITDLPAQRWLGRVQPPLGGVGEAALLSHRNEIAQMPELHLCTHTSWAWLEHTKSWLLGLSGTMFMPGTRPRIARAAPKPGPAARRASVTNGDNNVYLHRRQRPAATSVTLLQDDHPRRRHHGHDLRG